MKVRKTWEIRRDIGIAGLIGAIAFFAPIFILGPIGHLGLGFLIGLALWIAVVMKSMHLGGELQLAKRRDAMAIQKAQGQIDNDLWNGLD